MWVVAFTCEKYLCVLSCRGGCRSEGVLAFFGSTYKKKIIVFWKDLLSGKIFWSLKPVQIMQPLYT